MASTALREYPAGPALLHTESVAAEAPSVLAACSDTLAFSALLREVLADLREDPTLLTIEGKAEAGSSLESAA